MILALQIAAYLALGVWAMIGLAMVAHTVGSEFAEVFDDAEDPAGRVLVGVLTLVWPVVVFVVVLIGTIYGLGKVVERVVR